MTAPDDVLAFWFGEASSSRWFGHDRVFDQLVRERFGADIDRAADGQFASWSAAPPGRLAHIIMLDQFPRNAFRGDARAFAFDQEAVRLCVEGLSAANRRKHATLRCWSGRFSECSRGR